MTSARISNESSLPSTTEDNFSFRTFELAAACDLLLIEVDSLLGSAFFAWKCGQAKRGTEYDETPPLIA